MTKKYSEWRKLNEELGASTDCGEKTVREDFSSFAGLENEISFEEMLELEESFIEADGFTKVFGNPINL